MVGCATSHQIWLKWFMDQCWRTFYGNCLILTSTIFFLLTLTWQFFIRSLSTWFDPWVVLQPPDLLHRDQWALLWHPLDAIQCWLQISLEPHANAASSDVHPRLLLASAQLVQFVDKLCAAVLWRLETICFLQNGVISGGNKNVL